MWEGLLVRPAKTNHYQVELVLGGKNRNRHGWGANGLSNLPERFPRRKGKGWEGRGDLLLLPALIISQQIGVEGVGGGWAQPQCVWFALLVFMTPPIRTSSFALNSCL